MTNKKLYPIKFVPDIDQMKWGLQTWLIADMGFENSKISNGWLEDNTIEDLMETYLERVVGEDVYQYYGRQFPILVKHLLVEDEIPLQVHPSDIEAKDRFDSLGKAELLYITETDKNAKIYLGFNKDLSAQEFFERSNNGSIYEVLNEIPLKAGETYFIKPGLVHAIKGKANIIAIQQSSDLDFVLYAKGLTKEEEEIRFLHLSEAIDIIDYSKYSHIVEHHHDEVVETLVSRPEFTVSKLNLTDTLHIYTEKFGSFLLYICAQGSASIELASSQGEKSKERYEIVEGEAILIPAECSDFYLAPEEANTVLLEARVEKPEIVDSYIDPDTEPFLEGEDYSGLEEEYFSNLDEGYDIEDEGFGVEDEGFDLEEEQ